MLIVPKTLKAPPVTVESRFGFYTNILTDSFMESPSVCCLSLSFFLTFNFEIIINSQELAKIV